MIDRRREAVTLGHHPGEVDPIVGDEVEVVLDAVLADPVDLLDPERVRADPGDLLEVQRAPLPAARGVDTALDKCPRALSTRTSTVKVSGLAMVS